MSRRLRRQCSVSVANTGFSLIELLVVTGILTLLLALVPAFLPHAIDSAQLRSGKREIISSLRYARSKAISTQGEVLLRLNVSDNAMTIADKKRQLRLPDNVEVKLITATQEHLSEHEGAIRFYSDGSSTGGQITLRQGEDIFYIDVHWLTGRIIATD